METGKFRRSQRIAAMTSLLGNNPGRLFSLTEFSQQLDTPKSVLSEDISIVKETMKVLAIGEVQSVAGAKGGIRFIPGMSLHRQKEFLEKLAEELRQHHRILPGSYLYYSDLISLPAYVQPMAEILASYMKQSKPQYVVTVETKGIPLAFAVARILDKPFVVARRESLMTEGPTVSVNYVSGSGNGMQRMVLPRRAIEPGSRVVMVDDFMRGGGTAKGMQDLMKEFEAEVTDIGVLMASKSPETKRGGRYTTLLILENAEEETGKVDLYPNPELFQE
ncbi:pur operon repressor [Tindallia californiensis]|uniref:Purine operon repressor, PurR n=1 Tax=Tindallia californiensis TaxID=159292 RepID=A0A1H3PH26_9FIRM|nr:pur operon repressor [Tindallia californiensis]SDZ00243.1 purine operon repressor, PurR [Tindallia californiensis]